MADTAVDLHGFTVLQCDPAGPSIVDESAATDVIGSALGHDAELVIIPVARLADAFFTLSTRLAGDVLQKFVNYRLQVAILGDISAPLLASESLRAFVRESNRGRQVWFVADLTELEARLRAARA